MLRRLVAFALTAWLSQEGHGHRMRASRRSRPNKVIDSEADAHDPGGGIGVKDLAMMLVNRGSAPAFHAPAPLQIRSATRPAASSTLGGSSQTHVQPQMAVATLPKSQEPAVQAEELASFAPAVTESTELETKADPQTSSDLITRFSKRFSGHFDNLKQFLADKEAGREPMEGGGHEHIHCHLQRLPAEDLRRPSDPPGTEFVYSSYYFEGLPEKMFRERIYVLQPREADEQFGLCIQMTIRRIRPETAEALREVGGDASSFAWSPADVDDSLGIPNSDLFWRWQEDRFDGRMRTDSVVVHSPIRKTDIIVKDDLALLEGDADGKGDALWCNDRGSDTDGNHIFGNIHDIPYKMDRVGH